MPARAEPRSEGKNLSLLDERRSAHASIRGYLYQTCLGVLRWLDLQPNEILLCEGDEDLDRFLLGGGAVSEQVKAYTGGLSITGRVVRDSLRNFLRSYVALRQRGETRTFVFTTTAYEKKRRDGLDFDLLEKWRNGDRSGEMVAKVRSLVQPEPKDPKKKRTETASRWLDGESERWVGFMNAVEWSFSAPDLGRIRKGIRERLAARDETRLLDPEALLHRLVVHVLETSTQSKPRDRVLSSKDFSDLVGVVRTELTAWWTGQKGAQIRAVLSEVEQVKQLLDDNTSRLPPNASPGKLLTAAYEVIPFDEKGRSTELDLLADWCNGDDRQSILLLTGEGGSGKTRLMTEWCRRLRHQGWHAGFLRRDRGASDLDPLLEGSAPRLVVVDYAETRLGVVEPLLLKMGLASDDAGPKLRVVLLARRAADWWENLSRQDRTVGDLLAASPPPTSTTPLVSQDPEERHQAFSAAVAGFAWQLQQSVPAALKIPELSEREFERALYLHMAALAALQGKRIETAEDALKETLDHERRFWNRQVRGVETDASLAEEVEAALASAVAAFTLVGGATSAEQADTILVRVLKPLPLSPHHPRVVLRLLRRLYGGFVEQNDRYLEPLQPDLLGEDLVAEILSQDQGLVGRVLDGGNSQEAYSTLTVLTRLARRRPDLQRWLGVALQSRLEQLGEIALNVAVETGDPIGLALAKAIEEGGPAEVALLLRRRCDEERYQLSVPLREVAHVTTEKGFSLLREQRSSLDEEQQAELARLANNLGIRLRALGRREDALGATQGAVEIRRQLARQRPDAFLPDLAGSLNNLGLWLSDLGRREDALGATQQAIEIYRRLARQRPDAFLPDLATSLDNLGIRLSELGRREDALVAAQEAVEIRRQLARQRPDAFLPDLATSLNNLGTMLSDLGCREDALVATQEAVEIRRQLARQRPDAFLPDLAMSLNNLGAMLSGLGRREDAFLAAEEAVRLLTPFFLRLPAAFAHWMSKMVRNYVARAEAAGKEPDEALLAPITDALQSLP